MLSGLEGRSLGSSGLNFNRCVHYGKHLPDLTVLAGGCVRHLVPGVVDVTTNHVTDEAFRVEVQANTRLKDDAVCTEDFTQLPACVGTEAKPQLKLCDTASAVRTIDEDPSVGLVLASLVVVFDCE